MSGRVPSGRALTVPVEPASSLAPSGFDPSRVHGLGLGRSNEWYTPPQIFNALGVVFDLDPAHPAFGTTHVPAAKIYSDNGLEREWSGFVWLNPPFGGRNGLAPWLDKFFAHGDGVALTPDRTSAPWFHNAWRQADAVMFCRKTPFLLPNGDRAGSPAFGTALWAAGANGVAALRNAASVGFGLLALRDSDGNPKGGDGTAPSQSDDSADPKGIAQ